MLRIEMLQFIKDSADDGAIPESLVDIALDHMMERAEKLKCVVQRHKECLARGKDLEPTPQRTRKPQAHA